jgi:hypothetical protein
MMPILESKATMEEMSSAVRFVESGTLIVKGAPQVESLVVVWATQTEFRFV